MDNVTVIYSVAFFSPEQGRILLILIYLIILQ